MTEFGEHWTRKMKTYFKRLDSDGNGFLTANDFQRIGENLIKTGSRIGANAATVLGLQTEIWTNFFQQGTGGDKASLEAMIENHKKQGKAAMKAAAEGELNLLFDAVDTNLSGTIQFKEFLAMFRVF